MISDGYTETVVFHGGKLRGEIELTYRPYVGLEGTQQSNRLVDAGLRGQDQTPIAVEQIIERVADLKINGKPIEIEAEALRKLRAPEFESIIFAVLNKLIPDEMVVVDTEAPTAPGEAPPTKRIPYPSAEEREGN